MKNKIISLNLAIFMFFASTLPVSASFKDTANVEGYEAKETYLAQEDKLALKRGVAEDQINVNCSTTETSTDKISLFSNRSQAYRISVGNTSFWSDEDKQGSGWTYSASINRLSLNGYFGSGIKTSGDLVIYADGINNISGDGGVYYGDDGISVSGNLDLFINSGTTYVLGGYGSHQGGDGIATQSLNLYSNIGSTLVAYGGDSTAASKIGGDGIYGESVYIYGNGRVNTTGGNATASNGSGGSGIIANEVYIYSECNTSGGRGIYGGPGIFFVDMCVIGPVNATINGGTGLSGYAIQGYQEPWYYNSHTIVSGTDYRIVISVRQYTLRMLGAGGTRGRATFTSLTDFYPKEYCLSDYLFQREGYTQVGWKTSAGELLPLNQLYTPLNDEYLLAEWIDSSTGDIILNALSGVFIDGERFKKYKSTVVVPSSIDFDGQNLLGWSSDFNITENTTTGLIEGVWYSGDSFVVSNGSPISLFAHSDSGKFVVYHPTKGSVKNGGTMLVQGNRATFTDLQVYALNDSYLYAPEGYTFSGWTTLENSNVVEYTSNEPITLQDNGVLDLYAVWTPKSYSKSVDNGIAILATPILKQLKITISDEWIQTKNADMIIAAVYEENKLIQAKLYNYKDKNKIELSYPNKDISTVKLFVWDENFSPLCAEYNFGSIRNLIDK